jgi:hypothetical protein
MIPGLAFSPSSSGFIYIKIKVMQIAQKFQDVTISRQDGLSESMLIIMSTQRQSNLTFPTLVFEGKGYSTGKLLGPASELQRTALRSNKSTDHCDSASSWH